MSSPYDLNLLAMAPPATDYTQQQGGRGHVPSLLAEKRPPQVVPEAYPESGGASGENPQHDAITSHPPPFWRTRKGIFIFIVAVVIIGGIIGGAVGGTRKDHSNETSASSDNVSSGAIIPFTGQPAFSGFNTPPQSGGQGVTASTGSAVNTPPAVSSNPLIPTVSITPPTPPNAMTLTPRQ